MEKLNKEAYAYYEAKDFNKAIELYNKDIEKYPDYSDFYANRGLCYYEVTEIESAMKDLDKAIELDPKNPEGYANRGYVNLGSGYNNVALEDLNNALALKDQLDTKEGLYVLYLNMGTLQNNIGNKEIALTWYDQAIALGTNEPGVLNAKGMIFKDLERFDEALECFNQALELDQNYAYAYGNRASIYLILKAYDIALADVNTALSCDRNIPQLYLIKGQVLSVMGNYQGAIDAYSTGLETWPGLAQAYLDRALAYSKLEKYTDAIIDYKFATDYGLIEGYKGLGYMFRKIGQNQDAIDSFNDYLKEAGDSSEIYMQLGLTYQVMKAYLESIQMFDQAILLSKDFPDPYILKAISYEYLGENDLALEALNKAIEIDPINQSALDELKLVQEDLKK